MSIQSFIESLKNLIINSIDNDENILKLFEKKTFVSKVETLVKNLVSTKTKKLKDPKAPKKPMNAYMLYKQEMYQEVKKQNPEANVTEITKIISADWKSLTDAKKAKYETKSEEDQKRYKDEMKSYVKPSEDELLELSKKVRKVKDKSDSQKATKKDQDEQKASKKKATKKDQDEQKTSKQDQDEKTSKKDQDEKKEKKEKKTSKQDQDEKKEKKEKKTSKKDQDEKKEKKEKKTSKKDQDEKKEKKEKKTSKKDQDEKKEKKEKKTSKKDDEKKQALYKNIREIISDMFDENDQVGLFFEVHDAKIDKVLSDLIADEKKYQLDFDEGTCIDEYLQDANIYKLIDQFMAAKKKDTQQIPDTIPCDLEEELFGADD